MKKCRIEYVVISVLLSINRNKIQAIIFMTLMKSKKKGDLFLSLFSKYLPLADKRERKNKKK